MLTARAAHSSCSIQSDNGSVKYIIILGGHTDQEHASKSTEILNVKDKKWVQGPSLPCGIEYAACVALPPAKSFACVVIGGWTSKENYPSDVYGLNQSLTEWTLLGNIRLGRYDHIALPLTKWLPEEFHTSDKSSLSKTITKKLHIPGFESI